MRKSVSKSSVKKNASNKSSFAPQLANEPIFTIGYSIHPFDGFLELLKANHIKRVIDIRTIPKSRHSPEYNMEELKQSFKKAKIGYKHLKELGGLRKSSKDSIQ